jgi:hypothetical protein
MDRVTQIDCGLTGSKISASILRTRISRQNPGTNPDQISDLKVIARTSTQRFKGSWKNLPEFARQLGVANILERTVQKAADRWGLMVGTNGQRRDGMPAP